MILLGLCLGAGTLLVHAAMRLLGQPLPLAVLSASQLGVPVAAVTIGAQSHLLQPGEGAAMLLGALITIAASAIAGRTAAAAQDAAANPSGTRPAPNSR
jgi:hypothetical protein